MGDDSYNGTQLHHQHAAMMSNNKLMSNDISDQVIKTALPGFQAPQGMTQVPIMFSGSIPSLQYQDSSKGILQLQHSQQNNLSPAQAFLNQQLSRNHVGNLANDSTLSRESSMLPPIVSNQKMPVARMQQRPD